MNFDAAASDFPSYDPAAANLIAIMDAVETTWESIILDSDVHILGRLLNSLTDIHCITNDGIIYPVGGSDISDGHDAGVEPDAYVDPPFTAVRPLSVFLSDA